MSSMVRLLELLLKLVMISIRKILQSGVEEEWQITRFLEEF